MSAYRIFFVGTAKSKPGKGSEAATWWRETGQAFFESYPGVKSLQVFANQFGLGSEYGFEFWFEFENYAVFDFWDADLDANPQKYGEKWVQFTELFDSGPSRVMGDWPESHFVP